jgi:hypothetical protein
MWVFAHYPRPINKVIHRKCRQAPTFIQIKHLAGFIQIQLEENDKIMTPVLNHLKAKA